MERADDQSSRSTFRRHIGRFELAGLGARSAAGVPATSARRRSTFGSRGARQSCSSHRSLSRFTAERGSRGQYISLRARGGSAMDAAESRPARPATRGCRQAAELGPQRASPGCLPGCHEHAHSRHPMDYRSRQRLPRAASRRHGRHPGAPRFSARQRPFDEHAAAARN